MMKLLHVSVRPHRLRGGLVAAALVFAISGTGTASAANSPVQTQPGAAAATGGRATFGIKPSHATLAAPIDARPRFDYTATPGAQQPDYVAISNDALTPLTLSVYASDAFDTASGGFDLLPASKKPVDVGSWITLKTNTVTLKPGASVVVPFTVKVPTKVAPGDHVGGIVTSLRTYGVDKKGDRVAIDTRVGTRVYLRIQGPLDPRLAITDLKTKYVGSWWNPFSAGKVTVSYTAHNLGNVRLGSTQDVDVSGWYGGVRSLSVPQIAELLPDNAHSEQVVLTHVQAAFHERVAVTLTPFSLPGDTDGRLAAVSATVHFWAVPWALLVLIVILLALLILAWRTIRRKRQPAATQAPSAADDQRTTSAGAQP